MAVTTLELRFHTCRDLQFCHPIAKGQFMELAHSLVNAWQTERTKTRFGIFETYRNPFRQRYLKNDAKTSKADAFQSAHQFGLAVDFVPFEMVEHQGFMRAHWSWDEKEDWQFLKERAENFGLEVPIAWDRCHVQHPQWYAIRDSMALDLEVDAYFRDKK